MAYFIRANFLFTVIKVILIDLNLHIFDLVTQSTIHVQLHKIVLLLFSSEIVHPKDNEFIAEETYFLFLLPYGRITPPRPRLFLEA